MKIEELSIGDWVQDKKGTKAQILGIEKWSDGYELNVRLKGVDVGNTPATSAHPIPLTPEILEKNGWVKITEDMVWAEHLNPKLAEIPTWGLKIGERLVPYLVAKMRDNSHFEITTTNIKLFRFNAEHVHQLQHVLRLAGIEKEIEL